MRAKAARDAREQRGGFADLDCWMSAKVDIDGEVCVGGLLTSIVGGVQK